MAQDKLEKKLESAKYHNYLKEGLALLFTKRGIQGFVKDEIERFCQKCLTDSKGQPLGNCSSCRTQNVVRCPTDKICMIKKGKCRFHKNAATKYRKCPNGICDSFANEITRAHEYDCPSFHNTDASQWCSNPWEVAKCFMPPDGYNEVYCVEETDFNGVINVCVNCKDIVNKIHCRSLLEQARDVGKCFRHCANFEIKDADLQSHLSTLKMLLSEIEKFTAINDAKEAKEKIIQMEQGDMVVKINDLNSILTDAESDIKQRMQNENDEHKKEHLELIKESMFAIKDQETLAISALKDALSDAENQIKIKTDRSIDELQNVTRKLESDMNEKGREWIERIDGKRSENFIEQKQEFKVDLVNFNKIEHNSVSLSPLFEEIDTPVEDLYVPPDMVSRIKKERVQIKSLADVFYKKDIRYNEIYITAEAGFGKTAFCKRLVMAWCLAQEVELSDKKKNTAEEDRCFSEEDISTMKNFNFLFLVSLRDAGDECNIDDMIMKQILSCMPKPSMYSKEFLEEILSSETCLVILDGLDEWMHTSNECTKTDKQLPHRNVRPNTTIATTTRPWKISVLALKTRQIQNTVEIKGLNKEAVKKLTINAIKKMNDDDTEQELLDIQVNKFNAAVEKSAIKTLQYTPLLLLYMICLWKDGIELGRSISEFYVRTIDFLLSRCKKRIRPKNAPKASRLPSCFEKHKNCKTHYGRLIVISELAFRTLFSEIGENTLVFDKELARKYISDGDLKMSLKSGILTQSKIQNMSSSHKKISFSHKSIHEFFAALYMYTSLQNESEDILNLVKSNCRNINDIFQMKQVYLFLSGINSKIPDEVCRLITEAVVEDQRTQEYRKSSLIWDRSITQSLVDIQTMFVDILNESCDSGASILCLQDVFIGYERETDEYKASLQKLMNANKTNIKTMSVKSTEFDDTHKIFNFNEIKGLEKVFYRNDKDILGEEVNILLKGSIDTLKYLTLNCHKWQDISCKWPTVLSDQLGKLKKLQGIAIEGFVFEHELLQKLMDYLKKEAPLLEVSLYNLNCACHDCDRCCTLDLSTNERIKVLRLNCIPLKDITVNVSSLVSCDVGHLKIIEKYMQQIESADKLTTFLGSFLETENDIKYMIEKLPSLRKLTFIQLRKMNVGVNQLQLPSEIQKLILWEVKISSESLTKLKEHMEKFHHSIRVEIKECTVIPEGNSFEDFKDSVRHSPLFSVVNLDEKSGQNSFVFEKKKLN